MFTPTHPLPLGHCCLGVLFVMLILLTPAAAEADCYCSGDFAQQQMCLSTCENNARLNASREALQARMPEDLKTVVPEYLQARETLRQTPSNAPDLPAVFARYQQARERRDTALLGQYTAQVSIASALSNGQAFKQLDDLYAMPEFIRPTFHAYAMKMANALLDMAQNNGQVRVDSRYPQLLDETELQAWAKAHGGPKPQLVFGRVVLPKPGEGKPLDELSAEDRQVVASCRIETEQAFPTAARVRRDRTITDKTVANQAQAHYLACMKARCKACDY
ncbi:hypothetical protein [Pseudomonas sp. NPDC007930]|uniref:hypothetical protein n=1 Tax=Pseudomonas sp. NPDC007930 TaxID=3364417 RepID=UPI0036EBDF73